MQRLRRAEAGISPVVSIIILILITLILTSVVWGITNDQMTVHDLAYGTDVTFEEAPDGSVQVVLVDTGSAESVYVQTAHARTELTSIGATVQTRPGEGDITILAVKNDHTVVIQTYSPRGGPTELLIANATGEVHAAPGNTYRVDGTSSVGTIVEYEWDFGDGTIKTGSEATHSYATSGVYEVELTVTGADGSTHTDSMRALVGHIVVDHAGRGDAATIADGLAQASTGQTMFILNGTYAESATVEHADFTIIGIDTPIIDGSETPDVSGITITGSNVRLDGVTVRAFDANGIRITGTDATVENVTLTQNGDQTDTTAGLSIGAGGDRTTLTTLDALANDGCGILIEASVVDVTISDAQANSNRRSGLCLPGPSQDILVQRTDIKFNGDAGITAVEPTRLDLRDSEVAVNHNYDLHTIDAQSVQITDSSFAGGYMSESSIWMSNSSDVVIDSTTIAGVPMNDGGVGLSIVGLPADNNGWTIRDSSVTGFGRAGVIVDAVDTLRIEDVVVMNNGFGGSFEYYAGIDVRGTSSNVTVRYSKLIDNENYEMFADLSGSVDPIDARQNWWGTAAGPTADQYSSLAIDASESCDVPDCSGRR